MPRRRRVNKAVAILALALSFGFLALRPVDIEASPMPYIVAGDRGRCYVKMAPDNEKGGIGTAFQVSGSATETPLWSVSGWYAFTTFVSHDGRYLVRMGNWPRGDQPSDDHLAVAFY